MAIVSGVLRRAGRPLRCAMRAGFFAVAVTVGAGVVVVTGSSCGSR